MKQPERVDAFGQHLKARYLAGPEDELVTADKDLQEGREQEALERWRRLAKNLRTSQKGDTLFPVRQAALRRIAETSAQRADFDAALGSYEALIHIDPRDLTAQMQRNALLLRIPGQRRNGEIKIRQLFERLPTSRDAALAFLRVSSERRDLVGALRAAEAIRGHSLARAFYDDWRFYWDTGANFSKKQAEFCTPTWTKDGGVELSAWIEENAGILRFRVDTPMGVHIRLKNPRMVFDAAGQLMRWTPPGRGLRLSGIKESESGWVVQPEGLTQTGHFIFDLPSPLSGKRVTVYFSAKVRPLVPAELRPLLADRALVAGVRRELISAGGTALIELLDSMLEDVSLR